MYVLNKKDIAMLVNQQSLPKSSILQVYFIKYT